MRGNLTGFILAAILFASLLAAPSFVLAVGEPPEDLDEAAQVEPQVTSPPIEASSVETSPAPLVGDVFLPPDTHGRDARLASPESSTAPEPGFLDTSRFMMGSVAYALIMPESNGTVDVNQEDWTAAEIASVSSEVQAGVTSWAGQEVNASLTFSYDPLSPRSVNTSYEPITRPSTDEGLWITEAMAQLGYTTGSYFDRVRQFDNDLRTAMGTDWAFTLFVVDDTNDAGKDFSNGFFGYAYLGGPFIVMTYDNDGWGIARMNNVTAHEVGHIFWATDEYDQGPMAGEIDPGFDDELGGYLNIQEIWLSGCVMDTNNLGCVSDATPPALSGTLGTYGQIGWLDSDGDSAFDILDVPPETMLTPHADPTNNVTPTYTGTATVAPFPPVMGTPVTINTIADVEYRVDGGSWSSASAVDGAFNETSEAFTFTTPLLAEGNHTIEARAKVVVSTPTPVTIYDASPASDILQIDVTAAASSVDPLANYTRSAVFNVFATTVEGLATIDRVELFAMKEGGPWVSVGNDTVAPYIFQYATAGVGVGDGLYRFYSIAHDSAGNVEASPATADAATIVDTVAPASAVDTLPTYETTTSFVVNATATDPNAILSVELFYRKDGGSWTSYGVDAVPPYAWNFDASGSGDGFYEFYSIAIDGATNDESQPLNPDASTTIDTGPPTSSANPAATYQVTATFAVTATAVDLGSGVTQVELFYRKDGGSWTSYGIDSASPYSWTFDTATTGGDGLYEFYTAATDVLTNVESPAPAPDTSTTVDTAAPASSHALSGTIGTQPWYVSAVSVALSATDATSGVSTTMYRMDGGAWQDYTGPFDVTGEGSHTVEYASTDAAGNSETARSVEFGVDLAPPALFITAPGAGAFVIDAAVLITWTASDSVSGLASCAVSVDGGPPTSVGSTTSLSLPDIPDGSHRAEVSCTDAAGHTVEEAVAFTFVTTNVIRTTPLGGSWIQILIGVIILLVIVAAVVRWRKKRARGK